jgi:hypothetical protein
MDINAAVGGKAGLARAKIEVALGMNESNDLSEREQVALEYADRVSATPVDVPDEFFANLKRLFSDREIVELTAHIAHENYNAKSNRPLRVVANNFCDIPFPTRRDNVETSPCGSLWRWSLGRPRFTCRLISFFGGHSLSVPTHPIAWR